MKDSGVQGQRLEEAMKINLSLSAFGKGINHAHCVVYLSLVMHSFVCLVILALTSPGQQHIPYRDSKLTRILQDRYVHNDTLQSNQYTVSTIKNGEVYTESVLGLSIIFRCFFSLGGNCKTTLITTITPVSLHYSETVNSLKFANRSANWWSTFARSLRHVGCFSRAKSVKNYAMVNEDFSQQVI